MNKKHARGFLLAAALCCTVMAGSAFAANEGGAVVNTGALNFRAQPNTGSEVLAVVYQNQPVIVEEVQRDNWCRVLCSGVEGYMSGDYLDVRETLNADFGTGVINGIGVRLRSEASYTAAVLGNFNTGTKMSVTGVSGEWYKVSCNGTDGYVHSDYLTLQEQELPSPSVSKGQAIVDCAKQFLGVPYVWAGTSPKGFDCSGLVYYCFKENGYTINRTAATIYSNGTAVDRSALQIGDVICFTNSGYGYIGHVGIYIGDNQFIHASSGSGYVTVNSLTENYYNNHYYGARRIAE